MKITVDEAGVKTTDDHVLIGGHHRLAVSASLGKRLFWRDTGEPVKLDHFPKHHGSSVPRRLLPVVSAAGFLAPLAQPCAVGRALEPGACRKSINLSEAAPNCDGNRAYCAVAKQCLDDDASD